MSFESPRAREAARTLLFPVPAAKTEPTTVAVELSRVYTRVVRSLRRSVGDDGCDALLARALAHAEATNPVVTALRREPAMLDEHAVAEAIADAIAAHGEPAVRAGVESTLAAIVALLSRLVGEEMALSLIDDPGASTSRSLTHGDPP